MHLSLISLNNDVLNNRLHFHLIYCSGKKLGIVKIPKKTLFHLTKNLTKEYVQWKSILEMNNDNE